MPLALVMSDESPWDFDCYRFPEVGSVMRCPDNKSGLQSAGSLLRYQIHVTIKGIYTEQWGFLSTVASLKLPSCKACQILGPTVGFPHYGK